MKLKIMMKDPDGVYECVRDAVSDSLPAGLSKHEFDALFEARSEEVNRVVRKWYEYGEYLECEIDTEAKTITVMECRK